MKFSSSFPPFPTRAEEVEIILAALQTVVRGRTAAYVSAPITTGRRFLEWRRAKPNLEPGSREYEAEHQSEVVSPNRAAAIALVRHARDRFSVVVDPTSLPDLPGWTQSDYRFLWGEVVRRHAHTVFFAEGWEFSTGCVYEFAVGKESGAELLDVRGDRLDLVGGLGRLDRACHELRAQGALDGLLEEVCYRLRGDIK